MTAARPGRRLMVEFAYESVTCLGCGCACDDIGVTVLDERITRLVNACPLGERWFGDGALPASILVDGQEGRLDEAIDVAANVLFREADRLLIYVGDDLTCDAHREAVALADRLGATVDGPAADTVAAGLLAAQRRGRASATLGELRHRADIVLFWGVDPNIRYPRFFERFVMAQGLFVRTRTLIAVDVGDDRGPEVCSERLTLDPGDEVAALGVMRATIREGEADDLPPPFSDAAELARRIVSEGRYVAIVFDAEPGATPRDDAFAEGLIAFAQALNGHVRAAAWGLRAGGNRNGFESVATWQTGYPFAVDFSAGHPVYVAEESMIERLDRGRYAAALVLGSLATLPAGVAERLKAIETVAVGPRAAGASFGPRVAIDTGAAGLNEGGLVLRTDDVPLFSRPVLTHPYSTTRILRSLAELVPLRPPAVVA